MMVLDKNIFYALIYINRRCKHRYYITRNSLYDVLLAFKTCANFVISSKKDGKDQESTQSSTTPDPGYHMEK